MFDNLLSSPGYAANVLRLFQEHPTPGHGVPARLPHRLPDARATRGSSTSRAREQEAKRLGINVPFDDNTPLSAYGSFFIARPEALQAHLGRLHPRRLPRRVRLRRRRAHARRRAAGQLRRAEHRPPLPRGDERRAGGHQLLLPRVPGHCRGRRSCPRILAHQIKRISKLKRIRKQAIGSVCRRRARGPAASRWPGSTHGARDGGRAAERTQ